MAKKEVAVLMRHPCVYEEVWKKFEWSDLPGEDFGFQPWDFINDPKYMANPVREMASRLQGYKRLMDETQSFDTQELHSLLGLKDEV